MKTTPRIRPSGFTLIQMVMVIAIIAIVAGIAIPALQTSKDDALTAKKNVIIAAVEAAKLQYYMDTKDTGFGTPTKLVKYMNAGDGTDISIFYTPQRWTYVYPAIPTTAHTGALLKGFTGYWQVVPGANGSTPTRPTVNQYTSAGALIP